MKNMKIIIVALALSATGTAALPITAAANAEEVAARPPAYATGAELAAALDADLRASAALSGPRSAAGSAPIPVWTPEIMALFKEMNLPLPPDAMTGFPVKQDAPLKQLGRRLTDRGEGYGYGGEGYGYGDYGLITATCAATEYVLDNECEACPSGFTCDGAVATVCDSIKYVLNNKCEDCPDGSTCDGAKATKCAAGIVKDNACEDCPDGHTCDGTKATKCAAPMYVKDNACTACPSGHTCDGTSATACAANTFVADNVCKSADQCMDAKYLKDNKCPCESWCDYDFYDWLYDYYYYYNYYYYSDDPWYFENWEERCNWSACSGCDECQHKVCKDSLCHGSKDPWKVKCAWDISDRKSPSAPKQGRACSGCSACINLGIESSSSNSGGQVVSSSSLAIIIPVVVAAVLLVAAVLYLVRKRRVAARQPHRASSMPMPAGEEVQAEA